MSARIRALLHELADAVADELAGREHPEERAAPKRRQARIVDIPTHPVSEVDAARAADIMRKKRISF